MESVVSGKKQPCASLLRRLEECRKICSDSWELEKCSDEFLGACRTKAAFVLAEIDRARSGGATEEEEEVEEKDKHETTETYFEALGKLGGYFRTEREEQEKQMDNLRKRCRRLSKATVELVESCRRQAETINEYKSNRKYAAQGLEDLLLLFKEGHNPAPVASAPAPAHAPAAAPAASPAASSAPSPAPSPAASSAASPAASPAASVSILRPKVEHSSSSWMT